MDIVRLLFPPRCISKNAKGKPCRNKVEVEGVRCPTCWADLAQDDSIAVRTALVREPNAPLSTINRLISDRVMAVRMAAAERHDLTIDMQLVLANDEAIAVPRTLAANPTLAPEARAVLIRRDDPLLQRQLEVSQGAHSAPLSTELGL